MSASITACYIFDGQPHTMAWRWEDDGSSTLRIDGAEPTEGETVAEALATIEMLRAEGVTFVPRHEESA